MWLRLRHRHNLLLLGGRKFDENTTAALGLDTSLIRFRILRAVAGCGEGTGRSARSAGPTTRSAGRSGSSGAGGAAEFCAGIGFVSAGGGRRLGYGSAESSHGDGRQPVGG